MGLFHVASARLTQTTPKKTDLEAQSRRYIVAHILAPCGVPLGFEHYTKLLAGYEVCILRVAHRVRVRVPYRRAVWESVEATFASLEVN